ncbi:MAG: shikimate dehydrogenase [Candidatus Omnitrophota bacterium]
MKKLSYKVFGIIGNPIKHSLSPHMHNAAFSKLKIKAVYLPFEVKKSQLKNTILSFKKNSIYGFNVTIPFKTDCIKYLDLIDPLAEMIGAVNTVVLEGKKFVGYNTDYMGFLRSVKEDLKIDFRNKRIMLLGAGGAARAVGFGCAKTGVSELLIYDIASARSKKLAHSIDYCFPAVKAKAVSKASLSECIKDVDLLVNCTPLGMKNQDPLPIESRVLHKGLKIYDIVYTPLKTKLVETATHKGIKAVGGLGMLLYQGTAAFELWTKKKAPVSLMRKVLLEQLKQK